MGNPKRVTLQFNEYDVRHRQTLTILRSQPRHMTELVVNAILHYVACPECKTELSADWIRSTIRAELAAYQGSQAPQKQNESSDVPGGLRQEDLSDLGSVMDMFRRGDEP